MKIIIASMLLLISSPLSRSVEFPPEIVKGFQKSEFLEGGGIAIEGDRAAFISFVTNNWRSLTDDLDSLPPSDLPSIYPNGQHEYSVAILGTACETLQPEEYVSFLQKWVGLFEKDQIPLRVMENSLSGVTNSKRNFVSANWQEPRIQAILRRAIEKTPKASTEQINLFTGMLTGKCAGDYLNSQSDVIVRPQTLAGVKLVDSDLGVVDRVKRMASGKRSLSAEDVDSAKQRGITAYLTPGGSLWPVCVAGIVLLLALGAVLRGKRRKASMR